MTNTKKVDTSTLFADSISTFTQSATKVFNDFRIQVSGDITRAEADARQARNERDQALKALQDSKKELQRYKDEILECKANLKEAELTNKHHEENYALLQRETNQWKDQARNWQDHFLRVEQERCSLSSRMDELVTERLIVPTITPKPPLPTSSAPRARQPQPPTYKPPESLSSTQDVDISQDSPIAQQSRPSGKSTKRKVPSQSELPPYSEVARTPQTINATTSNSAPRSNRKTAAVSSSRKKQSSNVNASPAALIVPAEVPKTPQEPKQVFIRRVHAVIEMKQEESEEDLSEPPLFQLPESVPTPRRSRTARRQQRIVDDDDYVPDDISPEVGIHEDAEDDELMIGTGGDLSFDVNSSSATQQTTGSRASPSKKRKLNTRVDTKARGKKTMWAMK